MLQQQAKLKWIKCGDENSKVFYQALKARRRHNRIHAIHDMNGNWLTKNDQVEEAFVNFYKNLFNGVEQQKRVMDNIVKKGKLITEAHSNLLLVEFTKEDVKRVMFSIPNDKAPGIDGFNSCFFKHCWEVIGEDISEAVLDFFKTGKLLKVINVTTLTLIPKVKVPENVSEFRPIACCTMLYKCITKLISERMNSVLPEIVSSNQGAFISSRSILHNVLICQDLVKHYNRKNMKAGCMMKLDLKKAYDSVSWDFIQQMLEGVGFPRKFIELVMVCVRTPRFSIMVNGVPTGFFEAKRGIRQGDPMSPLLFALCMDYLDRILSYVEVLDGFKFHSHCKSMHLKHLCFANDLLMFCHGDVKSIYMLLQGFQLFSHTSGLEVNKQKSEIYFTGMTQNEIQKLLSLVGLKLGSSLLHILECLYLLPS